MRKYQHLQRAILVALLALTIQLNGMATTPEAKPSIFDRMYQEGTLDMTLKVDLEQLQSIRRKDESIKADLKFTDNEGVEQWWKIKVKVRGKFRRMNCTEIPPLRLDFKKSDLEEEGLAPWDDLKLVTQCVEDKKDASAYLKKEYLAYKLYNQLSEYSYRVQLLRITYQDAKTGKKTKQWAFLIEDTAQMRARLGGEKCTDCINLPIDQLNLPVTANLTAFQYLIGNSDWHVARTKNIKIIRVDGKAIPVPYDFDFSGLVSASYSIPNVDYGAKTVQDRIYLGPEELFGSDAMKAATQHMCSQKETLRSIIMRTKTLTRAQRLEVWNYLEVFFENPVIQPSRYQPIIMESGKNNTFQ